MKKRLVLGYDGSCGRCAALAESIERSGLGIETMSLREPQMMAWREEELGTEAPWKPTLVEISNSTTRAWVGGKMSVALVRNLGVQNTWNLLKIIGEISEVQGQQSPPASGLLGTKVPRASFLKGIIGAGVGVAILANGPAARAATAEDDLSWFAALKLKNPRELSFNESAREMKRALELPELKAVFSDVNSKSIGLRERIAADAARASRDVEELGIRSVVHTIHGGGKMTATMFLDEEISFLLYEITGGKFHGRSYARVLRKNSSESADVLVELDSGRVFSRPSEAEIRAHQVEKDQSVSDGIATRAATATSCAKLNCSAQGACYACRCASVDLTCSVNCCGPCAFGCSKPWLAWGCAGCILLWCPACAAMNRCCTSVFCDWRC
jgi:hypothetical protein